MSTPLLTRNLSIVIDGSVLGCTSDFSHNITKEYIEIVCMQSTAKSKTPDIYDWTMSFSGFMMQDASASGAGYFELVDNMINFDVDVSACILPDVNVQRYLTGNAYLSSLTFEGGVGAAATYSGELTGNGPLSIVTTA